MSNSSLKFLDAQLGALGVQNEIQVSLLKKAQDQVKLEGQAAVQLIEQSVPQPSPAQGVLDVTA